jgi:DNA-directed RNA polymerase alpha subunit
MEPDDLLLRLTTAFGHEVEVFGKPDQPTTLIMISGKALPVNLAEQLARLVTETINHSLHTSPPPSPELIKKLNIPIASIETSVRLADHLRQLNVRHIGDAVQKTKNDYMKKVGFGPKSFRELIAILTEMNLILGMSLPWWAPPQSDTPSP